MPTSPLAALRSQLNGFLSRGVTPSDAISLQRIVRLSNATALASLVIGVCLGLMMIPAVGWWSIPCFAGCMLYAIGIRLNWRRHHVAARWTIILAATGALIFYSLAYGATPSFHVGLLIPVMFSVMAFSAEERRHSLLAVAGIVLACFAAMTHWHVAGPIAPPMAPYWATTLDVFGVCMTFVVVAAAGYTFVLKTEKIELELADTNQALLRKGDALAAVNESLQAYSSHMEEANREISEQSRLIERANRHKSEFLANMSHELRTPLNSMLLLSKLMADNRAGYLRPEEIENARVIHDAGKSLLTLINDILDLSRIEAGKTELQPVPVAPRAIASALERRYRSTVEHNGLDFVVETAADLPDCILADSARLQQIITNLLSNAMKFTHAGEVRLALSVNAAPAQPQLRVAVTDTGIGIPADKLDSIFRTFEQADGSTSRQYGGTGLGLALSRKLAELMGGTLTVDSEVGVGSTFTLAVPLVPVPDPAPLQDTPEADAAGTRPENESPTRAARPATESTLPAGMTVLLVDDDMRSLFSMARILKEFGARVVKTKSGAECLEKLEELGTVDMVLTDIMMPGMDGHELIRRIRSNPTAAEIPVIALTAKTMPGDREKVLACGATGFLSKPVDTQSLLDLLRRHPPVAS